MKLFHIWIPGEWNSRTPSWIVKADTFEEAVKQIKTDIDAFALFEFDGKEIVFDEYNKYYII